VPHLWRQPHPDALGRCYIRGAARWQLYADAIRVLRIYVEHESTASLWTFPKLRESINRRLARRTPWLMILLSRCGLSLSASPSGRAIRRKQKGFTVMATIMHRTMTGKDKKVAKVPALTHRLTRIPTMTLTRTRASSFYWPSGAASKCSWEM
jgi:hypothetical protein